MSISFSQPYEIQCPACGFGFTHDAWVLVDAAERPDLAASVADGTLHDMHCPRCGQHGVIGAPLLYHDVAARAVLFGVTHDMDEAEWREVAQGLLWMLIGALPETARLPYLGDVQAEAGLSGVAHALQYVNPLPLTAAEALGDALGNDDTEEVPILAEAMMALHAVEDPADFQLVFNQYPFLLDAAMDEGLAGLAEAATEQGEIEIGQAFERARIVLSQVRQTVNQVTAKAVSPVTPEYLPEPPQGWRIAVQALLAVDDPAAVPALMHRFPSLALPYADAWLQADEALLRDSGDLAAVQTIIEARALLRGERG